MAILTEMNKIQQLPGLSEGILTGNRIPVHYFETSGTLLDFNLQTTAKQVSLFPIIPSITWNFKF